MRDPRPAALRPFRALTVIVVSVLVAAVLASCGGDGDGKAETTTTTAERPDGDGSTTVVDLPGNRTEGIVYLLRDGRLGAARRTFPEGAAAGPVEALLEGPTDLEEEAGLATAVPDGTTVHSVDVSDDGAARVDLSSEFAAPDAPSNLHNRVAQVVFTLTQFQAVRSVSILIDGEPVEVLANVGPDLSQPQTRTMWESYAPRVLLEAPLPGDELDGTLRLVGTANTFEATFQVELLDEDGDPLLQEAVTTEAGTGARGPFDVTFEVPAGATGDATVVVYELSADDGSRIDEARVPVTL